MAPSEPWIISKNQDLLWFWGSALISLSAGAVALRWPTLALPLFCLWLLMADGPHFWATWTRSYWDPMERARRGPLLRRSLWIWAPGFACWGLSLWWAPAWHGFLAVAALWGYHHAVRQNYGIWALYARRAGLSPVARQQDTVFLYAILWGIFGWFSLAHPLNQAEIGLALPPAVPAALGVACAGLGVGYAGLLLGRWWRQTPVLPGLFCLIPCAGLYAAGFVWVGGQEPVIGGYHNLEQAFAVLALSTGLQHGLQYVGLVAAAGQRRYPDGGPSLAARLSAHPKRAWAFYLLISVPYLGLNLLRTAAPGVVVGNTWTEGLALCLYWGFVLHHYLLDQYIWRPHADPVLRQDLAL